jgi:benzoyl-CoA reductase/2-hydroxyglutaryl-CoA dehydratase subunit BcrC/BadD/HgdB
MLLLENLWKLDESGLRVVRDDLSIGERYFATLIPDKDDPIDSIINYHFNIPMPATKHPPDKRLDYLMEAIKNTKIDAVVSQNLKFCEPYAFDAVFIRDAFKKKDFPVIHLERDYTSQKDHQFMNRLEAFKEML